MSLPPDDHIAYGENPKFLVGNGTLKVILTDFQNTHILKIIPISDIETIKFVHQNGRGLEKFISRLFALFLGRLISYANKDEGAFVEITYRVHGDEDKTLIESKISSLELSQLKSHIFEMKKRMQQGSS